MGECWLFHCRRNFLVAGSNLVAFRPVFRRSSNYRDRATRSSWANRNYLQGNANPLTTWRESWLVGLPDKWNRETSVPKNASHSAIGFTIRYGGLRNAKHSYSRFHT